VRGGSSHLGKEDVVYNGLGIPIYQCPDEEIPPREEHPLPSVFSLLASVTKTEGKLRRPSRL
jgi:hypothetical protein